MMIDQCKAMGKNCFVSCPTVGNRLPLLCFVESSPCKVAELTFCGEIYLQTKKLNIFT